LFKRRWRQQEIQVQENKRRYHEQRQTEPVFGKDAQYCNDNGRGAETGHRRSQAESVADVETAGQQQTPDKAGDQKRCVVNAPE
jgi:hypothetical protein